jgi:hypothetical protein
MVVGKAHAGADVFVLGEKVGVEQERMSSTSASVPRRPPNNPGQTDGSTHTAPACAASRTTSSTRRVASAGVRRHRAAEVIVSVNAAKRGSSVASARNELAAGRFDADTGDELVPRRVATIARDHRRTR